MVSERPTHKVCKSCVIDKPISDFYLHKKGKQAGIFFTVCKQCQLKKATTWKYENMEKHLESVRKSSTKKRRERKLAVITNYTQGKMCCQCCEESHLEFLSVDHINGGGHAHRREVKYRSMWDWLYSNGFPEGYRILCFNCNLAIGFFGYCPHKISIPAL